MWLRNHLHNSRTILFCGSCVSTIDKYSGNSRIFHFEFHWRLSLTVFGMDISLADLQPQVVTCVIQHSEVPVFSPSAHLLLAIMHHGGKDQFAQLKQVLDISQILTKADWTPSAVISGNYSQRNQAPWMYWY